MKFFKSRTGAVIVMVLVIILSTAFSVHRSLGAKCREVTDSFYDGVYDRDWGARRRSIASQLEVRTDAAQGLLTLAEDGSAAAEELREARYELLEAVSVSDKYAANRRLDAAFTALCAELREAGFDSRSLEMVTEYEYRFTGAQETIDDSMYNDSVREFERTTLNVFPTNILKVFVASELPERFE